MHRTMGLVVNVYYAHWTSFVDLCLTVNNVPMENKNWILRDARLRAHFSIANDHDLRVVISTALVSLTLHNGASVTMVEMEKN